MIKTRTRRAELGDRAIIKRRSFHRLRRVDRERSPAGGRSTSLFRVEFQRGGRAAEESRKNKEQWEGGELELDHRPKGYRTPVSVYFSPWLSALIVSAVPLIEQRNAPFEKVL